MRPCECDNCPKDGPFVGGKGFCYQCWRYHNVSAFRATCDGVAVPVKPRAVRVDIVRVMTGPNRKCCGQSRADTEYEIEVK